MNYFSILAEITCIKFNTVCNRGLIVVQYCQEDADLNKKDHQDQTNNAEVMRFQKFENIFGGCFYSSQLVPYQFHLH